LKILFFVFFVVINAYANHENLNGDSIGFSEEELEYLEENRVVTYTGNPNWLPFEVFDKDGHYIGIVADHLKYIENMLHIKFDKKVSKTWSDALNIATKGSADVISGDASDKTLNKTFNPIDAYISNPIVIIMKNSHHYVDSIDEILEKKIVIIKNYGYTYDLYRLYPDIKFTEVDNIQDGLLGVETGKYDAMLSSLALASYTITKMALDNIAIVGKTDIVMNVTLFVNKDRPLLHSILNKAMHNLGEDEHQKILNRWRHTTTVTKVDYKLIWQILGVVFILFIFFVFRQRTLKKYTYELKKQKEFYEMVFKNTSSSLLVIDVGSEKFIDCNEAAVEMLKAGSKKNILNLRPSEISPEFQPDGRRSDIKSKEMNSIALKNGSNTFEWKHLSVDGEEFWVEVILTSITLEERKVLHVVWKDIGDKKRIEEELKEKQLLLIQQARLASMGEMINNIAHQWRQPLNALGLIVQKIGFYHQNGMLDENNMKTNIDKSMSLIGKMSSTIDDFRDFFNPDKDKELFSLHTVIDETYLIVEETFKSNSIGFKLVVDDNEMSIYGYKNELSQVIINLLNNSKDVFLEEDIKQAKIDVSVKKDKNMFYIIVCDNGGGVPDDVINKIFDPYFTTKEYGKGTGIGLYMSKIIIEDHMGGKLRVANTENGACFTIEIPEFLDN